MKENNLRQPGVMNSSALYIIIILVLAKVPALPGVPELSSMLAAIRAKPICPHGGLQVGKYVVPDEQAPWNDPGVCCLLLQYDFL